MTIEIVDFPMKHGDLNHSYVNVYQAGYTLQPFDRLTSKDLYVGFAWIVQPSLFDEARVHPFIMWHHEGIDIIL